MGFPDSSVGKESTCKAGDPGSIPGLGRSPGEGISYPLQYSWASLMPQLAGKVSTCNVGDLGLIPRLEISPGKGNSYPLQYSGLKNSMGPQRVGLDRVTFTSLHFATPWTAECQAPLSFTISWSLLKFMSVEYYLTISSSAPFSPFAFSLSHHQGFFPMSQLFT